MFRLSFPFLAALTAQAFEPGHRDTWHERVHTMHEFSPEPFFDHAIRNGCCRNGSNHRFLPAFTAFYMWHGQVSKVRNYLKTLF